MSEIEEFDEQLAEILDAVKRAVQSELPRLKGAERLEKCSYFKNRLNRAKQIHRSILVEARDLSPERALQWTDRAKTHAKEIETLLHDIEWAETSAANEVVKRKAPEEMTARELTTQALAVQEESTAATDRIKKNLLETEQIAISVNQELKNQGEQIGKIGEAVDQVDTNINRAQKQLRAFMRRMATDKIFLIFIFLIIIAIISIIVVRYTKDQPATPASTTPKAP